MKKTKRLAKTNAEAAARTANASPAHSNVNAAGRRLAKSWTWWPWAVALAALFVALEIYGPALRGPFVLDDRALPFMSPTIELQPFAAWIAGVRPLLMLSFWVDYQRGGVDPFGYHLTNVFLHFFTSVIVAFIAARLLGWAKVEGRQRDVLAVFAGALFLVHPAQTESVAYVASRSEALSVFFFYAGLAVFLYRGEGPMKLTRALASAALFGAAVVTKEHTAIFPVVVVLADYFWNRGGLRKNAIFYALVALCGAVGAFMVVRVLRGAATAGFGMAGLTPLTYFFTQCRVVWSYVRLFFLPFGQNVDPEVALSHNVFEHGAIAGLLAMAAVLGAAWVYRKRWPLASFGAILFVVLVAPTSSFVPILDPLAERRMYLPFLGLILILLELLRHLKVQQAMWTGAAACLLLAVLTYQRNEVWGDPVALWADTAAKSPHKLRPRFQLAYAYYDTGHCPEAAANYEAASKLEPPHFDLLLDWALALDCAGRDSEAVTVLKRAELLENGAHVHAVLGMVYAKSGQRDEALKELNLAEQYDPRFDMTYVYRGGVEELNGDRAAAARDYQRAVSINSLNQPARDGLARVTR
jgi:tetratricopeptide (TPR) repeat protein